MKKIHAVTLGYLAIRHSFVPSFFFVIHFPFSLSCATVSSHMRRAIYPAVLIRSRMVTSM